MKLSVEYDKQSPCTVTKILDVISGRWAIPILYVLSTGTKRFSELQHLLPNVSTRMLTKELKNMEKLDIIHRQVYATVPPTVEYSLKEKGRALIPVLMSLYEWGKTYL